MVLYFVCPVSIYLVMYCILEYNTGHLAKPLICKESIDIPYNSFQCQTS